MIKDLLGAAAAATLAVSKTISLPISLMPIPLISATALIFSLAAILYCRLLWRRRNTLAAAPAAPPALLPPESIAPAQQIAGKKSGLMQSTTRVMEVRQ